MLGEAISCTLPPPVELAQKGEGGAGNMFTHPTKPPHNPPMAHNPPSITHLNCIAPPCTNSILVQGLIGQLLVWLENLMWAGMQVSLTFLTSEIFTKVFENSALCLAPHKVVGSTYQDLEMARQAGEAAG